MNTQWMPMKIPKLPKNRTHGPQEPSREPLGTNSMNYPVSERSQEIRCASRAVNTMLLTHVTTCLREGFGLHFGCLLGYFEHPRRCKSPKEQFRNALKKQEEKTSEKCHK